MKKLLLKTSPKLYCLQIHPLHKKPGFSLQNSK